MAAQHLIDQLAALSRRFGPAARDRKLRLLQAIAGLSRVGVKRLSILHDTLNFMRAYPDDADILRQAEALMATMRGRVERLTGNRPYLHALLNSGLPGSTNAYPYSYPVLQRLVKLFPGALELDWEAIEDTSALTEALMTVVLPGETQALEDLELSLSDWLAASHSSAEQTDLELVLSLLAQSHLSERDQVAAYERCELPLTYTLRAEGSGRGEMHHDLGPLRYQEQDIPRERFDVRPRIRRPITKSVRLSAREGRRMLDLASCALASRNLEIYPLMYGDPADVNLVDVGRGLTVMLSGVRPGLRSPLEAVFFFSILKNGVPIAYGPASSFLGACEMGINLFPEFRGGEIRYLYAQLMRVLYHLAHVRYFFLVPYGMGEDNDDALKSGAFWFYRKLGFSAESPTVEALAQSEEAIMAAQPGYRSSLTTLRKLSHTSAYLDLSRGRCRPFPFGALGVALSRAIAAEHAGDRAGATKTTVRRVRSWLELEDMSSWRPSERAALDSLAPVLCLVPDLKDWPRKERRALAGIVRAKGGPREADYARRVLAHPRLGDALRAAAASGGEHPA